MNTVAPASPMRDLSAGPDRDTLYRTLPGRLILWAHDRPDQVALRVKDLGRWEEITWSGYLERTAAIAMALDELGVRPGEHVTIHSDNRPEWMFVDLAVQGLGARSVGVYQTNPPSDVSYVLNHSRSVVHFAEDQEQVDKIVEIGDGTPTVKHVLCFDPRGTHGVRDTRLGAFDDLLARGMELAQADPQWFVERVLQLDPGAPSMVVYTSGTTGTPKGAMLCSANALASQQIVARIGYSADDLVLSYLPLCHVAEKIFSLFTPIMVGCVVHFGESIETVRQDLRDVSPTIFLGVPRIWEKMHAAVTLRMKDSSWLKRKIFDRALAMGRRVAPRRELGTMTLGDRVAWALGDLLVFRALQERLGMRRCRLPVSGAAPIAAEILQWFHAIGIPVREGYGQTECAGLSHLNFPGANRLGSVGQVITGGECRIAEADQEVLLRGAMVFVGYLHNDEATAETIDADGWLHTGDIGTIDDDGFLWITGRKNELIITSGGKNLSPETIENALKTSPYVHEAVAIGDGRKFISALVQIEFDVVADWATRADIQYTSFSDLASNGEVLKLLDAEIHRCNDLLPHVAHVREFRTLPKELSEDDGEMTATQKVRRRIVYAAYESLVTDIYG